MRACLRLAFVFFFSLKDKINTHTHTSAVRTPSSSSSVSNKHPRSLDLHFPHTKRTLSLQRIEFLFPSNYFTLADDHYERVIQIAKMSSAEVINALFERTVDIVQSLPKTGPIQTSYEEKLALYSLYKQATEGDVRSKRPGMLDMLGRAKWDAWANRKGLGSQDAKQLYVESMLKTLRKFSDRPQAMQLIEELESFSGDVAQRVMSASLARAGGLDSEDDSQASSEASLSPRLNAQQRLPSGATTTNAYDTAAEDERDAVSQLPRTFTSNRVGVSNTSNSAITGRYPASTSASVAAGLRSGQRTPMSEVASAMAVRGGPTAGTATEGSYAGDSDEDRDVVTDRDPRRQSNPTLSRQPPLRPGMRPTTQGQSWQRSSGSLAGGEGRLYALPNSSRYPGPPASDIPGGGNTMGGGAGASLYSAVGPSARPTPSEQHYYHHHGNTQEGTAAGSTRPYAPSSIGGRSGGGGQRAVRADVDMALQSIQASLAGLHERMNRVENRSPKGRGQGGLSGSGHFSSFAHCSTDGSSCVHRGNHCMPKSRSAKAKSVAYQWRRAWMMSLMQKPSLWVICPT